MSGRVDPWRFTGKFLENLLSRSIPKEPAWPPIPWTPLVKPLAECRVALLSTAGLSQVGDAPFDVGYERKNPTRGDSSWRRLRANSTSATVVANHLHIDTSYIARDLNVALPLDPLRELAAAGEIGSVAPHHYSIMGYQGADASDLEKRSAPEIAAAMKSEGVDLAVLIPV
jgi:D-proline reductase (dithiol) PrdB